MTDRMSEEKLERITSFIGLGIDPGPKDCIKLCDEIKLSWAAEKLLESQVKHLVTSSQEQFNIFLELEKDKEHFQNAFVEAQLKIEKIEKETTELKKENKVMTAEIKACVKATHSNKNNSLSCPVVWKELE